MKGKIGLKKEVAEAVELAEFALELFDVNTADCLRLLGWRAWSYASPPRGAVCVRRSSGQGSRRARQMGVVACRAWPSHALK